VNEQITPQRALLMALEAEKRAKACFEHAARVTKDPATRALAREMAEKDAGIVLMQRARSSASFRISSPARKHVLLASRSVPEDA
jgi:leucyl aminopeptidase (aminopeptidase T)